MLSAEGPCYDAIEVGTELPVLTVTPTLVQLFLFSAVTWNAHRIHYDAGYAASEGYPAPVIHGPFQGALLGRLLGEWCGETAVVSRLDYSHRGIAFLGDTLACKGMVTKKYAADDLRRIDLKISIETQRGEATTLGHATIDFPA